MQLWTLKKKPSIKSNYNKRQRTIILYGNNAEQKREEILTYFHQTYTQYQELFLLIKNNEAFYKIADPLRHPLIFYLGHTATFFINKLILTKTIDQRINPHFESLFAVGVDEMSWDHLNVIEYEWPSVQAVKDYRNEVYHLVTEVIKKMTLTLPIGWEDPAWIVLMGIEHERIHLETSSVLIRQLPLELLHSSENWPCCDITRNPPTNRLIPVKGKSITLGKQTTAETYGWDNEYGKATYSINDFSCSEFLVSNAEYLAFVRDKGYETQQWWTEEGWSWLSYTKSRMPKFWQKNQDTYYLRLMADIISMPWDWPVEVNYLEAKAFCLWLSVKSQQTIRLPTEAEWNMLRSTIPEHYPSWTIPVGNIDLCYFASPCPVNTFKQGDFYDIIGNVWQWTETKINSFDGFKIHSAYDDFSIPTFDNKHNIIKGGSWISTGNLVISESRYAFRRHFYQHAGFRYVKSNQAPYETTSNYETDTLLSQYLEFHYGKCYFNVDNYQKKLVNQITSLMSKFDIPMHKAMDLGCAVGRGSFELAHYFNQIYGVDFSARLIQAAEQLKKNGHIKYITVSEGDLIDYKECFLSDLNITKEQADKIILIQGDACNLKDELKNFNLILAANLIDRLYNPALFLKTIHERLTFGGILVLSSPYTWLTEHTEKNKWLGGYKKDGENVYTLQGLHDILKDHFLPLCEPFDIEFVIKETDRKYQHTITQVTTWQRRHPS